MNNVRYIPEFRKNSISLGMLQENDFFYKSDGYRDIMKVNKGSFNAMRARRTTCNIYKLLENLIVCDVVSIKSDNDATYFGIYT